MNADKRPSARMLIIVAIRSLAFSPLAYTIYILFGIGIGFELLKMYYNIVYSLCENGYLPRSDHDTVTGDAIAMCIVLPLFIGLASLCIVMIGMLIWALVSGLYYIIATTIRQLNKDIIELTDVVVNKNN
jgi:hypothetical protein